MADSVIGTLRAILTLDSSQYNKGITEATTKSAGLQKELGLIGIGGAAAGTALLALAAEAVAATNRAADFADQIKEVALVTGMSTDQVQQWKHAADESGVSFDALTTVMRMFTQNIGKTGPAADELNETLRSMGISTKDANGNFRDTNSLMLETLSALKNMEDPVKRNSLAMQLYGRSWAELADFMEKDVDLAKQMADAKPISNSDLEAAEAYKNKMGELGGALDQVQVRIGTKLIPAFNAVAQWFLNVGVPAIEFFIDRVFTGFQNMWIVSLHMEDYVNGLLGNPTHYEDEFNAQLAANVIANNNANSPYKSFQTAATGASGLPTAIDTIGGGTGGSGGGGSGGGGSHGTYAWQTSAAAVGNGVYLIRPARTDPVTGQTSPALYGNGATGAVSTNPYAWNTSGPGNAVSPATTTYNASFGHMLSQLANVSGLSSSAQAVIKKYNGNGTENAQVASWIQTLKDHPDSPEAQAIIQKVLTAQGPMAGDNTPEAAINYLQGSLVSGAIHTYINPTGNDYNALKSEWDRLTTGSHPMFDQNGNLIVYVTIDGQEVAKAVVNKLALLGVSV